VAEQRFQAVLAVIAQGETVKEVAARWGVSRQTLHAWLAKYEAGGRSCVKSLSSRDPRGQTDAGRSPGS
jgi:transposase-like protein